MSSWPVQRFPSTPPLLEDLVSPLSSALKSSFKNASVSVVTPPDLRLPPWNLASPGISGHPRIGDIGGQGHLVPVPRLDKKYDLREMARLMEMGEKGAVLGASAGPFHVLGRNSELVPNFSFDGESVDNKTRCAKIVDGGGCECGSIDSLDCGLMANLFGSEGLLGPVLHVRASVRTGLNGSLTEIIQQGLKERFGPEGVSIGGVFVVRQGKANLHVMPDFATEPLRNREEVERWLRFFEKEAPITCLSVLHSNDERGLGLRMEHTHCFAADGRTDTGGHYHYDLEPELVEYEGYFNVAEVLYRIDMPE